MVLWRLCAVGAWGGQVAGFRSLLKSRPLIIVGLRGGRDFKGDRFASPLQQPALFGSSFTRGVPFGIRSDLERTQRTLFPSNQSPSPFWRTQRTLFVPFCLPLLPFGPNKRIWVRSRGDNLALFTNSASIGRQPSLRVQPFLRLLISSHSPVR